MEPEGSLSCSQETATGPYSTSDESSPHFPTLFPHSMSIFPCGVVPKNLSKFTALCSISYQADFYGDKELASRPSPIWRKTCLLTPTTYSIYSQPPFTSGGRLLYPQRQCH